ncbi:MAG: hypothetical protein RLZZ165_793 [Bacteroidota bacterium]|jgi:hypothetical protein
MHAWASIPRILHALALSAFVPGIFPWESFSKWFMREQKVPSELCRSFCCFAEKMESTLKKAGMGMWARVPVATFVQAAEKPSTMLRHPKWLQARER